jgi:hypothetical protein
MFGFKDKCVYFLFNNNGIYECNRQQHPYQENLACNCGIHCQENEVKIAKYAKKIFLD